MGGNMRLRNKKTGAIGKYNIALERCEGDKNAPVYYACGSLAKLNNDWEDYKLTEPLIKDEKIRKAVRAWAEAIGTASAFVEQGSFDNEHLELSDVLNRICFVTKRPKDIKAGIRYTITELCGEEEE